MYNVEYLTYNLLFVQNVEEYKLDIDSELRFEVEANATVQLEVCTFIKVVLPFGRGGYPVMKYKLNVDSEVLYD